VKLRVFLTAAVAGAALLVAPAPVQAAAVNAPCHPAAPIEAPATTEYFDSGRPYLGPQDVVSLYGMYLSNALGTLMRYHLGHLAMLTHFVLSGFLFFWVVVGVDPGRRRVPVPILVLVHFAGMAFHAFLGVVLMQSTTVIAADWYTSVHPVWAGSPLSDQKLGAGIAWAFGEFPAAVVMAVLVVRWIRDDEREQRRLDRAADRAESTGEPDALAQYNDFLRRAAAEARRTDPGGRRAGTFGAEAPTIPR
jgi:hypothetical protein